MQLMFELECATHLSPPAGWSPYTIAPFSNRTVFARSDLALYRGCPFVTVSLVCTTSHLTPFSTIEFWTTRLAPSPRSSTSNRGLPNGVRMAARLRPGWAGSVVDVYAAGPLVH